MRRSARLQSLEEKKHSQEYHEHLYHLPSPPHSAACRGTDPPQNKRKRPQPDFRLSTPQEQEPIRKRPRLQQPPYQAKDREHHRITHWTKTGFWPEESDDPTTAMSQNPSSKRRSESTHRSVRMDMLAKHGICMETLHLIQKSSKDLTHRLMQGNRTPAKHSPFPLDKLPEMLSRVRSLNESRIQRDVTPLVVPSAEHLFLCGELQTDFIGDEVNADWMRCATMGGSVPKPDYTAGILPKAFTAEEDRKLKCYSSSTRPFLFTPELTFPFLMCEVKTGERGINEADRQNLHSASIAVSAIIELYREASGKTSPDRVQDLYGKILVYTITHDHDRVSIYGHFAVASSNEELKFHRHQFKLVSLSVDDYSDCFTVYNFVRNVYDDFAPEHLERIKDATKALSGPDEGNATSFGTSGLTLYEQDSQQSSQNASSTDNVTSHKRRALPSSLQNAEIVNLKQQAESQREQIDKFLGEANGAAEAADGEANGAAEGADGEANGAAKGNRISAQTANKVAGIISTLANMNGVRQQLVVIYLQVAPA